MFSLRVMYLFGSICTVLQIRFSFLHPWKQVYVGTSDFGLHTSM